jgi:apolipoprotein N-acyltransferase
MMLNTVYPGRRLSTGGALKEGKLFAEFFGIFMTDTHTPVQWQNICEASGFIMFFPVVFYAMGYYYFKTKKADPLLISISIFLLIGLSYVLVGFPIFLSRITLFSMSPDFRALPIVGVANCFLLICYIASSKMEIKKEKISWIELGVLSAVTLIFMLIVTTQINKRLKTFSHQPK